jgi:hypothetical protein
MHFEIRLLFLHLHLISILFFLYVLQILYQSLMWQPMSLHLGKNKGNYIPVVPRVCFVAESD